MVTRNWFDSIVSGYLYHSAGHECWIDFRGDTRQVNQTNDWDLELKFHKHNQVPFPPRNNRSLCSYLQEETEEVGIQVLMDVALSQWYKGIVPYYNKVQEHLQLDPRPRSLFLCYEDLVDPFQQEAVFYQILDWMFPGENVSVSANMPADMKALLVQQQKHHGLYSGGHASTHDVKLRARLRGLVERYDRKLFNNTVAASNAIFGCGIGKS